MRNVLHYQMCNFPLWVNQGPKPVYSRSLRWRVVQIRQKVIWPPALTFHLLDCTASIAGCSVSSVIKSIWWYLLFFIFWPHCMACGILVPLTMWSPNHWTTRKSLMVHFKLSTCCALMRWMKLEPIIQSEVSQKEKHQYSILTHIYGIRKMVTITLCTRQQKRHWCIEQPYGLCGRGRGWEDLGEWHWNM